MDFKDYYSILGVKPDADLKTIKKTYHQLAKKYHPDVNPGDKKAEEKFKEVTEAYQAISDPENRKKYDELRQTYQQWQQQGGRGNFDWQPWQTEPGTGGYTRTMSPEEFADIFGDYGSMDDITGGFSDFFSTIFGMGREAGQTNMHRRGTQLARAGRDTEARLTVTLEESYQGTTRIIQLGDKKIEAKIPKGVRNGSKIRLSGQGMPGSGGGPSGDLYLTINVQADPRFIQENNDLTMEVPVDFYTAIFGGELRIKTLSGEILLKIPPMSQSGKKFRLKGRGMPKLEQPQVHGDLYTQIKIVLPNDLSETELNTLKQLAERRKHQQ
ncbi:MAG: J domain-containing protein [Desulfitobacteriaceae bacterium]|nr:J domain-containing protein [Desulfitobacteriaceae bacterium]MDD4345967.1 J domain-containing protein [Desulfitobacteriaceae bacterium]MDD4400998.1 J domain-containing protein [Desulfitobacteriaceae bacterium]